MSDPDVGLDGEISNRAKLEALYEVTRYRPALTYGIILLSAFAAVLEGIGLSFLMPIIQTARAAGPVNAEGLVGIFLSVYQFLGIPFQLEYIIAGVAAVMAVRYTSSFVVEWLREALRTYYVRHLQTLAFEGALDANVAYFDEQGSEQILNAIVTQAAYAGRIIQRLVNIVQEVLISLMYLAVAIYLAPVLTVVTIVFLGGFVYVVRYGVESGYEVGDRVADANERLQGAVQKGTQGIRDVKLFGMADELFANFRSAVNQYARATIKLRRNQAAMDNFYQFTIAVTVFVLIYVALVFTSLSLGGIGVFLFAMFRLGPRVSRVNTIFYNLEGELPHLVRTQRFIDKLDRHEESVADAAREVPDRIEQVAFDDVHFSYGEEAILRGVSFEVERGEFVGFVGPSGAGKSTLVSLLALMYTPDEGTITANAIPLGEFDTAAWRSQIAVVRQQPYVFNDTLFYNLTVGNRDASREEVQHACEIARVDEFLDELPDGFETLLGDDGVRLSGGQRQRVAIARALLKDADVLLLDEATSDLDSTLEQQVHANIEALDDDRIMIVIAHRLSTVMNSTRIHTMEAGRIVETGTHDELLDNGGKYAELYSTQAQGP